MFKNIFNFIPTVRKQFVYAVDQARVTGTLVGLYLIRSSFAENRAVSLVGFSLGGVVSFNCMRMIKRLNDFSSYPKAGTLINDVMIWAGAYIIDLSKKYEEILEKSQNCLIVNGNLNNLYSKVDFALKGMGSPILYNGYRAIGLYAIFKDIKEEDKERSKAAINYDLTVEAPGHSCYGPNCGQFLHLIKDYY